MFNHSLTLGKIDGIAIRVNWSWIIIFVLIAWSLATAFFPMFFPTMSVTTYWIVGAISALLLFVSVLLHELGHSITAKSEGIPVRDITLFIFGGVSSIENEPRTWQDELKMAAAGPLVSVVLGVVCLGLYTALAGRTAEPVEAVLLALAFYNLVLAVFNLLPGFPLDGGRIFRSIVWGITHSFREATNVAVAVGHLFAYLFIIGGFLLAITGDLLSGLWLVFIGWFLNSAASQSKQQVEIEALLRGAPVSVAMQRPPAAVPAETSVGDFVEHYVLGQNLRAAPVVGSGGQLVGLVTLADARQVPRNAWGTTPVAKVMRTGHDLAVARPDEPLSEAMKDLASHNVNQLPVVRQGELVGMLTRADVVHYMQVRQDVGKAA
ncbi:MAG TPA: site-2 protease family protein [Chloroflexota bacterium]|nr:site-2 protease family protein [Chloroflexota bacterium]